MVSKELNKTLNKEIKLLEETIIKKMDKGDLRGVNMLQKRLTKLKRKLYK